MSYSIQCRLRDPVLNRAVRVGTEPLVLRVKTLQHLLALGIRDLVDHRSRRREGLDLDRLHASGKRHSELLHLHGSLLLVSHAGA
jgi:hypothetical protein